MIASTSGLAPSSVSTSTTTSVQPPALEDAQRTAATIHEGQRAQQNAQILQASMDVSISAGNHSMTLLYRAAIDKINETLAPELGPDAIAQAQQQDQSSDAVAERIVSQSTALFDRYAAKYPHQDAETLLQNFLATIRSGFEQGYGEAADILDGLGVWEQGGPVRTAIERTFTLVQQGFDDFLQQKLSALPGATSGTTTPATPAAA